MQKGNPLSFGADARNVINQSGARRAATLQSCVEVVHREADVMNRGASLRDKPSDWRVR